MCTELSIIVPAWNEEARLGRTLESYLPVLEAHGEPFEIIIVADGCTDRTVEIAKSFAKRNVSVLERSERLGKGGAVLQGMRLARYEYVGYVDADGSVPPSELLKMASVLREYDGVIASRWVKGSRVPQQQPFTRIVASRAWNFLVRSVLFLPVKDTQCGAKIFKKSVIIPVLDSIALTNWAFDVSLLFHLNQSGHKIKEFPVTWNHEDGSRIKLGKEIPVMFVSLIGVRIMNFPTRRLIPRRGVEWFLQEWGRT